MGVTEYKSSQAMTTKLDNTLERLCSGHDPKTFTIYDLEDRIQAQEKRLAEIRADRGMRYGKPDNTLSNVAAMGWMTAAGSLIECVRRIQNRGLALCQSGTMPPMEDLRNAAEDAVNYAHYLLIMVEDQLAKPTDENYQETKRVPIG